MIELVKEQESGIATLLKIDLGGLQASPKDIDYELEFPDITGSKGLVISGFPQYAALAVACEYKNKCRWIGIVDPKVNPESLSFVVVFSLDREYRRGDVVPLEKSGLSSPA
jgi:hypothetical protein